MAPRISTEIIGKIQIAASDILYRYIKMSLTVQPSRYSRAVPFVAPVSFYQWF